VLVAIRSAGASPRVSDQHFPPSLALLTPFHSFPTVVVTHTPQGLHNPAMNAVARSYKICSVSTEVAQKWAEIK